MRVLLVASLALGLSGCAALYGEKITHFEMAPRMEYQGFSFNRPESPEWYILRSDQDYTHVTLRRDLPSQTHSFYAMVSLGGIEKQPSSHEEFAEMARSKGQQAAYETHDISLDHELVTIQNQWCIRVETRSLHRGAPVAPLQDLELIVRGFRCLHPAWPKTTLDFFYSERGKPEELDFELSREGEIFLRGVRIDIAPETPAS